MRHRICLMIAAVAWSALSGCAFVNVNLLQAPNPLEEQVLEGEGPRKILIVDVTGFISEKDSGNVLREKPSTVTQVREALQKAGGDRDIAGVILRINSPGGTVSASDAIYHEVMSYRKKTGVPVHAVITALGTSGAYYVATAADEISAHPTAVTGSIGVLLMRFEVTGLLDKIGVSERTVKSGAMKDLMSPFRPATPEEEKLLKGIIDGMYQRFLEVVQARPGSRIERQRLESLADGRVFTAGQAREAGLIDRVGYLDDAIALVKQQAGLDRARVIIYHRPGSYKGSIYAGLAEGTAPVINLLNIDAGDLEPLSSSRFLYLWH